MRIGKKGKTEKKKQFEPLKNVLLYFILETNIRVILLDTIRLTNLEICVTCTMNFEDFSF